MLKPNNPDIDVDALMARVHHEVLLRQFGDGPRPQSGLDGLDTSAVDGLIAAAAQRGGPRDRWPARIRFFPFNVPWFQRFALRVISWLFRDQHAYNAAVVEALRQSVALNVRLRSSVQELDARLRALEERG
jgi:hypothetical protein